MTGVRRLVVLPPPTSIHTLSSKEATGASTARTSTYLSGEWERCGKSIVMAASRSSLQHDQNIWGDYTLVAAAVMIVPVIAIALVIRRFRHSSATRDRRPGR